MFGIFGGGDDRVYNKLFDHLVGDWKMKERYAKSFLDAYKKNITKIYNEGKKKREGFLNSNNLEYRMAAIYATGNENNYVLVAQAHLAYMTDLRRGSHVGDDVELAIWAILYYCSDLFETYDPGFAKYITEETEKKFPELFVTVFKMDERMLFQNFKKRNSIQGIIKMCEDMYHEFATTFPSHDPHEYLVLILRELWNFHTVTKPGSDPADVSKEMHIWVYACYPAACIEPPSCARFLAYQLIEDDKELFPTFFSEFREECKTYHEIISKLSSARKEGTLKDIYCKYNKNAQLANYFFKDA